MGRFRWAPRLGKVCLVGRTNRIIDSLETFLRQKGIDTVRHSREKADTGHPGAVRLATMHRVKGLEFDTVIVVAANEGNVPLEDRLQQAGDEFER